MMKKLQFIFLSFLALSAPAFCGHTEEMGLPAFGQTFHRKKAGAPVYLKCTWAIEAPERGTTVQKRSFDILSFADQKVNGLSLKKGEKVGSVSATFRDDHVEHHITILDGKKRRGFATWAIQTLASVLKAPSRDHLPYTHFCSTVANWNDASVALHTKLGFVQAAADDQDHQGVPGQPYYILNLK